MTFLDFFAGIGGFRKGMEMAGHKCLGFCENDKYAIASYTSMHCITEDQRAYLKTLNPKQRQKEILNEKCRNGEWFADDIRSVDAGSLPKADCWCFGFPCQDISVAGGQAGLRGDRSSLFFATTRLIRNTEKENRPKYLFIENVKNLLGVNQGFDFARILIEMDEIGYDAEWQVLNSKDFGVPQNRERIYIIGHLRNRSTTKIFPIEGTGGKNNIRQIGKMKSHRNNPNQYRVYDAAGLAPTINGAEGGGRTPYIVSFIDLTYEGGITMTEKARTLKARYYKGVANHKAQDSGIAYINQDKIAIRKLTPKECFRLQGWNDSDFEKAQFVNSDTQLYKQAGNGVTVNVVFEIAKKMK